jgi:type II secretory pathway component PulF
MDFLHCIQFMMNWISFLLLFSPSFFFSLFFKKYYLSRINFDIKTRLLIVPIIKQFIKVVQNLKIQHNF